jgi:branched-chain amino acid transport system substrate-binding protein
MERPGRTSVLLVLSLVFFLIALPPGVFAGGKQEAAGGATLKIGVLGVMSGAAASWGLVMKYCTEAIAQLYNEQGGVQIDGKKYKIEVVSVDDKNDPKVAKTGMERLVYQDKVRYVIGTNIDDTTASSQPVMESAGAINITYAFARELFKAPHFNTILGMHTPYTSAPVIYKYMMEKRGVKTASFIARNDADSLYERTEGLDVAKAVGLTVVSWKDTYEPGTTDFFPVMTKVIAGHPDLIVLSGVSPGDAPQLIKAARELGYKGNMSTETGQDAKILKEVAGDYANGYVSVGGASTAEWRSAYMEKFMDAYTKIAGEWNDEAGTKCYAPEMVLLTLQKAGAGALKDVEVFKKAIPQFEIQNPFIKQKLTLKYVGAEIFGQPRQIGVPLVITQYNNGDFETLIVKTD